ncbi:hypothetical protein CPAR01_15041 [Colletotrichum paranaense]|uniref:Heterokaryon incompatibility domain-containing protein n=1 Tax=Colletotrichum paranaense TaxID=1914294 RepID=A0ABQ9S202_9PEZI|nr:uncharacterized protein CPAR01_15041 [Colletotrichum paranaense]KAK1521518.1 hypothetical protein CPAR01_15041 [Colletotrichum paranaense]
MQDDTGHNTLAIRPGELEKVQGLWKFQVQRVKAQTWAYRDIKFLVYDDTADADESDSKTGKTSENTAIFERPPKFMPTSSDHDSSVALQTLGDGDEDPMFKQAISSLKQPHSEAGPAAAFEYPPEDDDMDDPDLQEAIRMSLMSDDESSDGPITADPSSLIAGSSTACKKTPEDENMDDPELQEAIRLSLMSDGESVNAPISGESGPSVTNTDEDEDVFECRICSKLPTFPHDKETRNFRLFKPADEFPHLVTERPSSVDVCVHYVAVSYCWPEEIKDEYGNTVPPIIESKVRDLNGKPRAARALDDVLDRAVDFANSVGLRMIWIDQECLPQPKEDGSEEEKAYQRLGVQALDIVYNRAIVTAGLHESTISKTEMSAIQLLIQHKTEELRYLSLRPQLFQYALDFLYMVQADKWYTRAWVIQEAVSAGDGLVLVFRRGPGVVYTSKLRADQKKYSTPRHPLDSERRTLKSKIICIPVGLFRVLVETCKSLLEQRFQVMGQALIRSNTGKNAIPILSVAESLHPKITVRQHVAGVHVYGGKVYGGRQKVNAATALTLLKSRHCRDVQDRLTILANMCTYEIRLDPIRVAKECDSLRLGILAITLLNGDTSLLVPEVYDFPGDEDGEPDPSMDRRVGSLLSPFDTDSKGISSYAVQDGKLVNPAVYKHSFGGKRKGLHLCAYLWTVDDTLDLSPLKYRFAQIWHRMKCLRIIMDRQNEESVDEFARRKGLITQHFSKNHVRDRAKSEIFHHGVIAADSSIWEGLDARGIQVKAYLDAYRVEAEPEMQKIVAEIFFAILRYLHDLCTTQSLGAANSIWQSIRTDAVYTRRPEMPDLVGEQLFSHEDVLVDPFRTLQLDKDRGGGYYQAWIVDRIMHEGVLFVARYNCASNVPLVGVDPRPSRDPGEGPSRQNDGKVPDNIIQRQFQRRVLATLYSSGLEGNFDALENHETRIVPSSLAWLGEALKRELFTAEAEQARTQQLISIFDVDGPCLVATVFNSDWEVLPRPDIRSMSICWVVEPVEKAKSESHGKQSAAVDEEQLIIGGKGKESERKPFTSNTHDFMVGGKGKEPEHSPSTPDAGDLGIASNTESAGPTSYRVLDKVKGMWQIMDLPMQEYAFI